MKFKTKQLSLLLLGALLAGTLAFGVACGEKGGSATPPSDPGTTDPPGTTDSPGPGTTVQTMPETVFASLSGKATFDGSYTQTFNDPLYPVYAYKTMISFGEDTIWVRDSDVDTGNTNFDYVCVNKDGKLAIVYHAADNSVAYQAYDADFASSYNPFASLKASDFILQSENVYALTDTNKAEAAVLVLVGEELNVTSLTVTAEDGKAKTLSFLSEDNVYREGYDVLFDCDYSYDVEDIGTGRVPDHYNTPYPVSAETEALAEALRSAAKATSYTVHYSEIMDGEEEPVELNVYVTGNAAYTAEANRGFAQRADGIYSFTYDTGKKHVLLGEKMEDGFDFHASFSGFSPALLRYEDGTYEFRADFMSPGSPSPAAVACASAFAVGGTLNEAYAYNVTITLEKGMLGRVAYDYYNTETGESGYCLLQFEDFNKTSLPAEVDVSTAKTLFEAYEGVYVDTGLDGTGYKLEITTTSIFLTVGDGERLEAQDVFAMDSGNDYLIVYFTVGSVQYMFTTNEGEWAGNSGIVLSDGNFSSADCLIQLLLPEDMLVFDDGVPYPTLFYGTYEGMLEDDEGNVPYTVVIDKTGVTLTAANTVVFALEDIDYSNLDGIRLPDTATYEDENGETQTVDVAWFINVGRLSEEKQALTLSFHTGEENGPNVSLTRKGEDIPPAPPFVMPEKYKGVFTGTGTLEGASVTVKIEIGEGITVTINDGEPSVVEFVYDEKTRNFRFELNGIPYVLMDMSDSSTDDTVDDLQLDDDNNYRNSVKLTRKTEDAPAVEISSRFYGTFKGTASNGTVYELKISADGFELKIGEADFVKGTSPRKDAENDYSFIVNGVEYNVYNTTDQGDLSQIYIMATSASLYGTVLIRQTEKGTDLGIAAAFFGKFEGTINGKMYVMEIGATSISVTIDGTAAVCEFVSCEQQGTTAVLFYRLKVKINGEECTIDTDVIKDENSPTPYLEFTTYSYAKIYRVTE